MHHQWIRTAIAAVILLAPAVAGAGSATMSGASNLMNPAISVNGLLLGQASSDNDDPAVNGVRLQEAEMQFTSVVDPFWTADVIISVYPDDLGEEYFVNVEEARIDATNLPHGLGLRLGKFFVPFGKHSPLHTHQFPFVESPLAVRGCLEDGFTEVGAMLSVPLPLSWFSDLMVHALDGSSGAWDAASRDLVYGARWTNFWDVGDTATLELGGSYLHGPGDPDFVGGAGNYDVGGVDLTYKWVSMDSSHGPAFTIQAEVLLPHGEAVDGSPLGWYALAQYRVHHDWWLGVIHGRLDWDTATDAAYAGETWEYKANLTYVMSEFSALRAEVGRYDDRLGDADEWRFALQANFTIGSHPAHNY